MSSATVNAEFLRDKWEDEAQLTLAHLSHTQLGDNVVTHIHGQGHRAFLERVEAGRRLRQLGELIGR